MLGPVHPFLGWLSSTVTPPWCQEGGDQGRFMQLNPSMSFFMRAEGLYTRRRSSLSVEVTPVRSMALDGALVWSFRDSPCLCVNRVVLIALLGDAGEMAMNFRRQPRINQAGLACSKLDSSRLLYILCSLCIVGSKGHIMLQSNHHRSTHHPARLPF